MQNLIACLMHHEGLRLKPYQDTVGKLSIGFGRNLVDKGISRAEAIIMLNNDIADCRSQLKFMPFYSGQSEVRKDALVELAFNLGLGGLLTFKKFIKAMTDKNYNDAVKELRDSKWATQVGKERIGNICERILNNAYSF